MPLAELHVVAQLEGVGLAVLADGPGFGEIGNDGPAVPVERDQRVEDHVGDVGGRRPGGAMAVEVRRVERLHHLQRLRLRGRSRTGQHRRRRNPFAIPRIVVSLYVLIEFSVLPGRQLDVACETR